MIKAITPDPSDESFLPPGAEVLEAPSMDSLSERAIDVVVSAPVEVTPSGSGSPTPPSEDFDA